MDSDIEELCLPAELYDEQIERKEFILHDGISVVLDSAPEHLQMSDKSAYLVVWPASIAMANLLIDYLQKEEDRNLKILELGSGVGLCGLALAKMSRNVVERVVLTDIDTMVLEKLHEHVDSETRVQEFQADVFAQTLFWGNDADIARVLEMHASGDGFDVVVGTDVTYCADFIDPLLRTASVCLKPSTGRVFLSYSMPRFAQSEDKIFKASEKYGLTYMGELKSSMSGTKVVQFNQMKVK